MRLIDLVRPYVEELSAVVDATPGQISLRSYLSFDGRIAFQTLEELAGGEVSELTFAAGTAVLGMLGPDPEVHGTLEEAIALLPRLEVGALAFLILGDNVEDTPFPLLLEALRQANCQILQLADLDYQRLKGAVVVRRVEALHHPRDFFGQGRDEPAEDDATSFAIAVQAMNSYLVGDFVQRCLVQTQRELQGELDRARQQAASSVARTGAANAGTPALQMATAEKTALARQVVHLQTENSRLRSEVNLRARRLQQIEQSTSLLVGRALVDTARRPGRGALTLPKRLRQLWLDRGDASTTPSPLLSPRKTSPPPVEEAADVLGDSRYLRYVTMRSVPNRRISIGVIARRDTVFALSSAAEVTELLPHDGRAVIGSLQPDLIIVESAAGRPGHAWASLGRPEAVEINRRLIEIAEAAELRGIPLVIVRVASGEAPALEALVPGAALRLTGAGWPDAPLSWTAGVNLRQFNPLGPRPDHRSSPALLLDGRPLHAADQPWVVDALERADTLGLEVYTDADDVRPRQGGGRVVPLGSLDRAAVFRRHPAFLASPRGQLADNGPALRTLEQLASGARVIAPSKPDSRLGRYVQVPGQDRLGAELSAAVEAGPVAVTESLPLLREIFTDLSAGATVHQLVERLGLSDRHPDPRSVAVLATVDGNDELHALVDDVLAQRSKPTELWVRATAQVGLDRALGELRESGLLIEVLPHEATELDGFRRQLRRARTPWIGIWHPGAPWGEDGLADLLLAAELSGAPMVARGGSWERIQDAPARNSLIRREVLADDLPHLGGPLDRAHLGNLTCRGHALMAISASKRTNEVSV